MSDDLIAASIIATGAKPKSYAEVFVIFLDILGFSDFIARSQNNTDMIAEIYEALVSSNSGSPIIGPPNYPQGLSYIEHLSTNFSDSLVISAPRTAEGLMTVLEIGRGFACVLLQCGLLTRGGVASGKLIHEPSLIFGPALVEAYNLESKVARYARIILSTDCIDFYRETISAGSPTAEYFKKRFR